MKQIRMVDLHSQYLEVKPEIDLAIQNVIDSTAFIKGEAVAQFEKSLSDYLGVKHVISCGNGTDAIQIAFMALDLPEGSEIICPSFTYAALAEAISLLKLKAVLVDVDPDTFNLDVSKIKERITKNTRVIAPVHLFGQCANMDEIDVIAKKYDLIVLEDAAQSIGGKYKSKFSGCIGRVGTTSFFPSKNLGCFGDGGAIFTNDDALASTIRMVANHGQKKKYVHEIVGVNSRLDGIQAAVLNVKLEYLDSYINQRQDVAEYYNNSLGNISDIVIPKRNMDSTHVYHQYTLRIKNGKRDKLKLFLEEKGIPSMIYYPFAVHQLKPYFSSINYPVSTQLCKDVLSLPIGTNMETDQLEYITQNIKEFFNK